MGKFYQISIILPNLEAAFMISQSLSGYLFRNCFSICNQSIQAHLVVWLRSYLTYVQSNWDIQVIVVTSSLYLLKEFNITLLKWAEYEEMNVFEFVMQRTSQSHWQFMFRFPQQTETHLVCYNTVHLIRQILLEAPDWLSCPPLT